MSDRQSGFDLTSTYIQLRDGPDAIPVPVGKDFWARIAERTDLHEGRLVMVGGQSADWTTWEMHPAGEEVLYLLSGALDLVLQNDDGERTVELRTGAAFIVPRGTWHRGPERNIALCNRESHPVRAIYAELWTDRRLATQFLPAAGRSAKGDQPRFTDTPPNSE